MVVILPQVNRIFVAAERRHIIPLTFLQPKIIFDYAVPGRVVLTIHQNSSCDFPCICLLLLVGLLKVSAANILFLLMICISSLTVGKTEFVYVRVKESARFALEEEDINRVSAVLSLSRVAACILLRHYNWSVSMVNDEWFADEENVRRVVGLLEKPIELPNARELTCGICFENYPRDRISSAACGHPFCHACWRGFFFYYWLYSYTRKI
ncbi:E3 ubiquitin ligase RBR family protein [Dioscorea alata]|uniref:E3 ubiquitin ligase RBR family protein n=1 Tax=Dioscorea alata TaxID=55571 RepID=A0ACB7V9L6_DIOAL|nr:E3 ubiquitin ligase RBR family protein [Dioscorea alata]